MASVCVKPIGLLTLIHFGIVQSELLTFDFVLFGDN